MVLVALQIQILFRISTYERNYLTLISRLKCILNIVFQKIVPLLFLTSYIDSEKPIILNIPQNMILDTTSNEAELTWTEPSGSDNSGSYTLSSNYASGSRFPLGVTQVTYTAIDPSGNTKVTSFTINVQGKLLRIALFTSVNLMVKATLLNSAQHQTVELKFYLFVSHLAFTWRYTFVLYGGVPSDSLGAEEILY